MSSCQQSLQLTNLITHYHIHINTTHNNDFRSHIQTIALPHKVCMIRNSAQLYLFGFQTIIIVPPIESHGHGQVETSISLGLWFVSYVSFAFCLILYGSITILILDIPFCQRLVLYFMLLHLTHPLSFWEYSIRIGNRFWIWLFNPSINSHHSKIQFNSFIISNLINFYSTLCL